MEGKIKIDKSRFGNLSVVSFLKMELCKRVNAEWYLDCVLYNCDLICRFNLFVEKRVKKILNGWNYIISIKMYVLKVSMHKSICYYRVIKRYDIENLKSLNSEQKFRKKISLSIK